MSLKYSPRKNIIAQNNGSSVKVFASKNAVLSWGWQAQHWRLLCARITKRISGAIIPLVNNRKWNSFLKSMTWWSGTPCGVVHPTSRSLCSAVSIKGSLSYLFFRFSDSIQILFGVSVLAFYPPKTVVQAVASYPILQVTSWLQFFDI